MSPGFTYEAVSTPPTRAAVTTVDQAFMVGFSEKGSTSEPILITSQADITSKLGTRPSDVPYLWDALDLFFREGGRRAWVARRLGPTPVKASKTLKDGSNNDTLIIRAKEYGPDGNNIEYAVGTGTLTITYNDAVVETFSDLSNRAAYLAVVSDYVDVVTTGSSSDVPANASDTALTGGTDDRDNSTTTELETALAMFGPELGPGQLLSPGSTDSASQALVAEYAADETKQNNRIALLDAPDSATLATVKAAATALRATSYAGRCAVFAPWVIVPGPLQGQERVISPAALAAALMARNDTGGQQPADVPAAGLLNGRSSAATDLGVTTWTDADRDELNAAGVNAIRSYRSAIVIWGWRTTYDPDTDDKQVDLGPVRLLMQIIAQGQAVLDLYVLRRIDGKRHILVEVDRDLNGFMSRHVANGSLEPLFDDDTGDAIPGTEYQISSEADPTTRTLTADVTFRQAGMAENVKLRIVRRAHQEAL